MTLDIITGTRKITGTRRFGARHSALDRAAAVELPGAY
jgi:hypothetical protein